MSVRKLALAALLVSACASAARAQFANTEVSPPGAATPFRITKALWSWQDLGPGITYSVYRSEQPDTGFACILDRHPAATWTGDQDAFGPRGLYFYLVTAFDGTTDNSPGRWSNGTPRTLTTPCPRTNACCMGDGSCRDLDVAACAAATGVDQGSGTACATTTCPVPCAAGTPVSGLVPLQLVALPGGNFNAPIFLTSPPGDPRLFILERAGRIRIQHPDGTRSLFLDFSADVPSTSVERGALGLAFHPNYASNGKFYVHYSGAATSSCGPGSCTTLAEYTVSANPEVADPASKRIVFQTSHSQGNHNGGWLSFGPDGYLYTSIGDGGEQGDPNGRAQNLGQYMGKILRFDVDNRDPGLQYAVPPTNPFVGTAGAKPEIWAYGMRNPWRDSFDMLTGDLYVGDVGQNCWEEVSVLESATGGGNGANLGWKIMEGTHCFNTATFGDCTFTGCTPIGVVPDYDYRHNSTNNECSITGGYVYRGCLMPDWNGWYFFADYCGDWIDAMNHAMGSRASERRVIPNNGVSNVVSFGQDSEGEIYVIEQGGTVSRLVPQ